MDVSWDGDCGLLLLECDRGCFLYPKREQELLAWGQLPQGLEGGRAEQGRQGSLDTPPSEAISESTNTAGAMWVLSYSLKQTGWVSSSMRLTVVRWGRQHPPTEQPSQTLVSRRLKIPLRPPGPTYPAIILLSLSPPLPVPLFSPLQTHQLLHCCSNLPSTCPPQGFALAVHAA